MDVPGTTPALRLGPPEVLTPGTLLVVEEPFAVDPSGLVGADGPVRGVDGVALGRDIVVDRVSCRLQWSRSLDSLFVSLVSGPCGTAE